MLFHLIGSLTMGVALMIAVMLSGPIAFAADYLRQVNFEWEPITDAKAYDLEIFTPSAELNQQVLHFRTMAAAWSGGLAIGQYQMKVRSIDSRGVPGIWSEAMPFDVKLEKVKINAPALHESIKSASSKTEQVILSWSQVPAADTYQIEIQSSDGTFHESQATRELSVSLKLPVAREYNWTILAQNAKGAKSEGPSESSFAIMAKKLETPVIARPENEYVRSLTWTRPDDAETFDLTLGRLNPQTKKWSKVTSLESLTQSEFSIDPTWPGGIYRLNVRARAHLRPDSNYATASFQVHDGDRSPAAEFNAEIRKSIDRIQGWYGIASYLVTLAHYASTSYDASPATSTNFDALGGTERLGLGYMNKAWGVLAIADLAEFTDAGGNNITFASSELSAVWHRSLFTRGALNIQGGLYYSQMPIAQINPSSLTVSSYNNLAVVGSHFGIEYLYALTPKTGFQLSAHLYENLLTLQTPSGSALPTLSWQTGVLGSYRLSQKTTTLLGFTHREDHLVFQTSPSSTFQGVSNRTNLNSEYVTFLLEYGF